MRIRKNQIWLIQGPICTVNEAKEFKGKFNISLAFTVVIFLDHMSRPISPVMRYSMFWMEGHFFSVFHGLGGLHTETHVTSIPIM